MGYKLLWNKYNAAPLPYFNGNLVDVTALIVEEKLPQLFEHLEFDEEGYWLDIYCDSEEAVRQFVENICPIYQDLSTLERYVQRAAGLNV